MLPELSASDLAAAREALLGPGGEVLREHMHALSLGLPAADEGRRSARALGWIDDRGTLTALGNLTKDPLREYTFWLQRGRAMPLADELVALHPDHFTGLRVLEVGCGGGCNLFSLLSGGPARILGVDPMPVYLQFAEILAETAGVDLPELAMGSAEELPADDGAFDVVLCCSSLQYTELDRAIPEMARVLAPGGTLITINNTLGPFAWESAARAITGRRLGTLKYDLTALANTVAVQTTGRRRFGRGGGVSTARPIYPSASYLRRRFAQAGLRVAEDETHGVSSGETCFVTKKR